MNFLTVGINMRDVACSIARAGHTACSVNYFNPVDLASCTKAAKTLLGTDIISTGKISDEENAWKTFLVEQSELLLEECEIDFIVPRINNELIDPLRRFAPVVGNSLASLEAARDKWEFYLKARSAGISVPDTWVADGNLSVESVDFPVIFKPARGSRGAGVQLVRNSADLKRVLEAMGPERIYLLQEQIEGESFNVNFLSDGKRVVPLFVSRQLFNEEQKFIYEGNIGPVAPRGVENALAGYARFLEGFGLRGVMGIDFIVDPGDEFYLVDFNPRIQGSFEVIEESLGVNMFEYHFNCWKGRLPEIPPPKRFAGKRIISAKSRCRAPELTGWDFIRDVPHAKAFIGRGEPICTVVATGASAGEVEKKLAERAKSVLENSNIYKGP